MGGPEASIFRVSSRANRPRRGHPPEAVMKGSLVTWAIAVALLAAGALSAATAKRYDNAQLRLSFDWPSPGAIRVVPGDHDTVLTGSANGIDIKVVVRPSERILEDQHQFRLMSYFAGAWEKDADDCRGAGWDGCAAWHFTAESGKTAGVAEVGFGPGGTYMLVLTAPVGSFHDLRPKMRVVEASVVLY
jgi:hypothetical protein